MEPVRYINTLKNGRIPIFDVSLSPETVKRIITNDKQFLLFQDIDPAIKEKIGEYIMATYWWNGTDGVDHTNQESPRIDTIMIKDAVYLSGYIDIPRISSKRIILQRIGKSSELPILYLRPPPPHQAYVIGGHGEEKDGYFIVPKGSIIVAKVQSGELADLLDYNKYLRNLSRMNKDVLCNPLENINQIIDAFGSVAIFEPGDRCPNFYYNLLMCHNSIKACSPSKSGIIPVDEIITHPERYSDHSHMPYENKKTIEDKKDFLTQLYNASVWPVQQSIRQLLDQQPSESTMEQLITLIDKTYRIYQSVLSTSNPGVYYMFVCRSRDFSTNAIYSMENSKIKSNINTIKGYPKSVEKLFHNRIHNTQFRKSHLQNYYKNKTYKYKKSSSIKYDIMEEKNRLKNNSIELKRLYNLIEHIDPQTQQTNRVSMINNLTKQIKKREEIMRSRIRNLSSLREFNTELKKDIGLLQSIESSTLQPSTISKSVQSEYFSGKNLKNDTEPLEESEYFSGKNLKNDPEQLEESEYFSGQRLMNKPTQTMYTKHHFAKNIENINNGINNETVKNKLVKEKANKYEQQVEERIRQYEASPEFQSRSTSHYFPNPSASVLRPSLSRKAVVKQGRYRPSPTEQHQREMRQANIEENALREKAYQNAMMASKKREEQAGGKRRTRKYKKRSKPTRRHST